MSRFDLPVEENPLKKRIAESIDSLEAIASGEHPDSGDLQRVAGHIAAGLRLSLATMAESLGECRQAVPFSPLHPVLDTNGEFRWCCNHNPEHCSASR
jgi:hypothetical protein